MDKLFAAFGMLGNAGNDLVFKRVAGLVGGVIMLGALYCLFTAVAGKLAVIAEAVTSILVIG